MTTPQFLKNPTLKLCFIVFFIQALFLVVWVFIDNTPPKWDESNHILLSREYAGLFKTGFSLRDFAAVSNYYPPLYHVITAFFMILTGWQNSYLMTNLVFFLMLLVFSFLLIRKLFDADTAGRAIILLSSFPFIHWLLRISLIDIAVCTAASALAWYVIKSNFFMHKRFCIAAGITAGLAILIKWTFVIYILPFVITAFWYHKSMRPFSGMLISGIVSVITFMPWYYYKILTFLSQFPKTIQAGVREGDPEVFTLSSFLYYFRCFYNQHMGILIFILFAAGFFMLLRSREHTWKKIFITLSIAVPFVTMSLYRNKDDRYTIGYFVFLALCAAYGSRKIPIHWLAAGCCIFSGFSWYYLMPPDSRDFKSALVFSDIAAAVKESPTVITVAPDTGIYNEATFKLLARTENLPIRVKDIKHAPLCADYIITKTGIQGRAASIPDIEEFMKTTETTDFTSQFSRFKTYDIPNNEKVTVYKRIFYNSQNELKNALNQIFECDAIVSFVENRDSFDTALKADRILIKNRKTVIPLNNAHLIFKNLSAAVRPFDIENLLCSEIKISGKIPLSELSESIKSGMFSSENGYLCFVPKKQNNYKISVIFEPVKNNRIRLAEFHAYKNDSLFPPVIYPLIESFIKSDVVINLSNVPFPLSVSRIDAQGDFLIFQ